MPVASWSHDEMHLVVQQGVKDFAAVEAAVEKVEPAASQRVAQAPERRQDDQVLAGRAGSCPQKG